MTTPLGKKLAAPAPTPVAKTPLAVVLERGARGELVVLPELGPVWLQLISYDDALAVEAEILRQLSAIGLALTNDVARQAYENARAVHTLARAARQPEARNAVFGTESEWGKVDTHLIASCFAIYADVVERLSPFDAELTDGERALITVAAKKKDTTLLRSFGTSTLASFIASTEFQPATSPAERSNSGDSPQAS